jgi:hypothetical protein
MPMLPIVEISGSPQAGKDSVLRAILEDRSSRHREIQVVESGARIAPITKDHHPELMVWTVGRILSDATEAVAAYKQGDTKIRIFNRGLFDRLAWLEASSELFGLHRAETKMMQDLLVSLLVSRFRFRALVILTPPKLTLSRSERIRLGISRRRVLNEHVLTTLNRCYLQCADRYRDRFDMLEIISEFDGDVSVEDKAGSLRALLSLP